MWVLLVEFYGVEHYDRIAEEYAKPWAPVRELWGSDSASAAGQRAMIALAGGPAPLRDPNKPRPARRTTE